MALPTIEERQWELKKRRSMALMQKINILRCRDGCTAPEIQSMADEAEFDMRLLFGASGTDNINWNIPGPEGVIRMYYEIIYRLKGTVRNNIIKSGSCGGSTPKNHNTTCRSGVLQSAVWLTAGHGIKSGFYCGFDGLDGLAANEDNNDLRVTYTDALNRGLRGDFDVPMADGGSQGGWTEVANKINAQHWYPPQGCSTSFTTNIDTYLDWDYNQKKLVWVGPADDKTNSLVGRLEALTTLIGTESHQGRKNGSTGYGRRDPVYTKWVNNTLLGKRFRDIYPYTTHSPSMSSSDGGGFFSYFFTSGTWSYGDGSWDDIGQNVSQVGYTCTRDAWDSQFTTLEKKCISIIDDTITWINRTKVSNFTYFMNTRVIPGINPGFKQSDPKSSPGPWTLQEGWISTLQGWRARLQQSVDFLAARTGDMRTNRTAIDTEIKAIRDWIPGTITAVKALCTTLQAQLGSVDNGATLYGSRYFWIRSLLHGAEGTLTSKQSLATALEITNKKLAKCESELTTYGLYEEEWIVTPDIVGVEPYPVLNPISYELEIGGWLVAWGGQEHCNGYDVWKSMDYDPATKNGTWVKLNVSKTEYTMTDVNVVSGKVLTYIIDKDVPTIPNDVDPATVKHPYYKVKAYDINAGAGDYARKNAMSLECEPKNPAAFPTKGNSNIVDGASKQRQPPVQVVDANKDADDFQIPPNTLFWTTVLKPNDSNTFDHTVFTSQAPLDSDCSNLIVFIDGKFKNRGPQSKNGDYRQLNETQIQFYEPVPDNCEINLVCALRSFAPSTYINPADIVESFDALPKPVENGTVKFVSEPPPGKWYIYVDPPGEWIEKEDEISLWKAPVKGLTFLPTIGNQDGDVRMTLDNSAIYRWDSIKGLWVKVSMGGGGWLDPVMTAEDLGVNVDETELTNKTLCFVISENAIYRYNVMNKNWIVVIQNGKSQWKDPVNLFQNLPGTGNADGDIRLTLIDSKVYRWSKADNNWLLIKAQAALKHNQLEDIDWLTVEDHDARYYPRTSMDSFIQDMRDRMFELELLKPRDAADLHGICSVTGTTLLTGYLSESSMLNFDTLKPTDKCFYITKSGEFILGNNDTEQFRNGDEGVVICYINDKKVDEFNLKLQFDNELREKGQNYTPSMGSNRVIEILSVTPFNQYNLYQRADFKLHIRKELLIPGENKIRLEHELRNFNNDISKTDDTIIFYDNYTGEMGFKGINISTNKLLSNTWLSGIRYFGLNDSINIQFVAENLFNYTYVLDDQIYVDSIELGITPENLDYRSAGMAGTPQPRVNETLGYNREHIINISNIYFAEPTLRLIAKNPAKTKTVSYNTKMLINTTSGKATGQEELFTDESYRLPFGEYNAVPGKLTGNWNSATLLGTQDLQCYKKMLIYPQEDFRQYVPVQQANYMSSKGSRYYFRLFQFTEQRNNGTFEIAGFSGKDENITIDLKLPGQTGWLSLNKMYNAATFTGQDGDGCVVSAKAEIYQFTTGIFNSINSKNVIIMRIRMTQKTNYISSIRFI